MTDTTRTSPRPTSTSTSIRQSPRARTGCVSKLRRILRVNAANCVVSGTALAVAGAQIDELLGTGHPGWVRLVGIGLFAFAALCWWTAAGSLDRLRAVTPLIVAGDIAWVVASAATSLLGWFSDGGVVVVLAMAVVVDTFAVLQGVAWRRIWSTR